MCYHDDRILHTTQGKKTFMTTVDNNGLNTAITATVLSDYDMRKLGFTDYLEGHWYYGTMVGHEISCSVSIPKDGGRLRIDVLDESFGQPYDYQTILRHSPELPFALDVKSNVEKALTKLSAAGVIQGYTPGMYV